MSILNSNLASLEGFDLVMGLTQDAINDYFTAAFGAFPATTTNVITFNACYTNSGTPNEPVLDPITLSNLPVNPFGVISATDQASLINAGYLCGFQATIGIPGCCDASNPAPLFSTLQSNSVGSDNYMILLNLLCSTIEFSWVDEGVFYSSSQSTTSGDSPFIATAYMNLQTNTIDIVDVPSCFSSPVTSFFGTTATPAFGMLALNTTVGDYAPNTVSFSGISNPSLLEALNYANVNNNGENGFVDLYMSCLPEILATYGSGTDSYTIPLNALAYVLTGVTGSTAVFPKISSFSSSIVPNLESGNSGLSTLNFLFAFGSDEFANPLPQMGWDWFDTAPASGVSGILAVNSNTLFSAIPVIDPFCLSFSASYNSSLCGCTQDLRPNVKVCSDYYDIVAGTNGSSSVTVLGMQFSANYNVASNGGISNIGCYTAPSGSESSVSIGFSTTYSALITDTYISVSINMTYWMNANNNIVAPNGMQFSVYLPGNVILSTDDGGNIISGALLLNPQATSMPLTTASLPSLPSVSNNSLSQSQWNSIAPDYNGTGTQPIVTAINSAYDTVPSGTSVLVPNIKLLVFPLNQICSISAVSLSDYCDLTYTVTLNAVSE